MKSSINSQLIRNISRYDLDSRIGKLLLSIKGRGMLLGERISSRAGYSPEIMDYRQYRGGDPIKDIDWKISARQNHLLVKIREGFSQTDFTVAIDTTSSMKTIYDEPTLPMMQKKFIDIKRESSHKISKFVTALSLAYIAGRIALKSRDRFYVFYLGGKIRIDSEQALLKTLVDIENGREDIEFWHKKIDSSANLIILSDFFVEKESLTAYLEEVQKSSTNIYAMSIHEDLEEKFDFSGKYRFLDPEKSGFGQKINEEFIADTRDIKNGYIELYKNHFLEVKRLSRMFGIRYGRANTGEDPFSAFIRAVS